MHFSDRLKELVGDADQGKVAAAAGVSPSAMHNYLAKGRVPRADELAKLASYFRVTMDSLYWGRREAEMLNEPSGSELDLWRKRAQSAERRLDYLRKRLRELVDETADAPTHRTSSSSHDEKNSGDPFGKERK